MKVEVVLTESDIAQEFAEAIEARDLPEKFFYWFPRSALAWVNVSRDAELFGGLMASWDQLAGSVPVLAKHFGKRVPVISFGAGDGGRDCLLLKALKNAGCECQYFPVDASQAMLEIACAAGEDVEVETTGIKADVSSPVHLVYAADAAEPPRLFIMSGNTMGSFDPLAEIRYLSLESMKAEDRLIVDGELYHEESTMRRRDNPTARRFLYALLGNVGIGADDGEIRFDDRRDERHAGLHLIARSFRAAKDLTATVAGEAFPLERGERIGLNFQYTYTPEAFRWLLRDHGGFHVVQEFVSPDGRFLTALCAK